jgi:hypothetical protein
MVSLWIMCASCFFIGVCAHALGGMVSLYPSVSYVLALICFSQKFAKGGDCWVFVLAALLLKQIFLLCKLEPMFQHVVRRLCKMLDTMFQHPGTVQCAWVHAYSVRAYFIV